MPHSRMSALNFFSPIIKKHVWRTRSCRLPLWAGCWSERRDNTCGLELKHSRSANNLLSLNFKTSPLARAANKLSEDSACTGITQWGSSALHRKKWAGKLVAFFSWKSGLWSVGQRGSVDVLSNHIPYLFLVFPTTLLCKIKGSYNNAVEASSVLG